MRTHGIKRGTPDTFTDADGFPINHTKERAPEHVQAKGIQARPWDKINSDKQKDVCSG